jgi:hypothetical protein
MGRRGFVGLMLGASAGAVVVAASGLNRVLAADGTATGRPF